VCVNQIYQSQFPLWFWQSSQRYNLQLSMCNYRLQDWWIFFASLHYRRPSLYNIPSSSPRHLAWISCNLQQTAQTELKHWQHRFDATISVSHSLILAEVKLFSPFPYSLSFSSYQSLLSLSSTRISHYVFFLCSPYKLVLRNTHYFWLCFEIQLTFIGPWVRK